MGTNHYAFLIISIPMGLDDFSWQMAYIMASDGNIELRKEPNFPWLKSNYQ